MGDLSKLTSGGASAGWLKLQPVVMPPMPVTMCEAILKVRWHSPESYQSNPPYGRCASLALAVDAFQRVVDEAVRKDHETHEANVDAIAHNAKMRAAITEIMKLAGIPDEFHEVDRNSRARWPKKKRHDAGYLGDLKRNFPIDDGFDRAMRRHAEMLKAIEEAKPKVEREKQAVEQARLNAIAARKADLALAAIILRHKLDEESTWDEALLSLSQRNKYLDLAVAGRQTRGDWSEGFYRVQAAFDRFKIESDQDKDIAADLLGCLRSGDDGDRDGRIFRDTTWNYEALFALVGDKQLVADVRTCMENV